MVLQNLSQRTWSTLAILVGLGAGMLYVVLANKTSPVVGSAAFFGLIFVVLILRKPELGIVLTAAVVPLERLGRFTSDTSAFTISIMRVVGVLTLGSLILHYLLKYERSIRFGEPLKLYAMYWVFGLFGIFHNTDLIGNLQASAAMLGNLLFYFIIINLVKDWRFVKMLILVWLASSVLLSLYTTYDWHFGGAVLQDADIGSGGETRSSTVHSDYAEWQALDAVKRAIGPTSHAAVYGINLVMTLPFFFYLLHTHKQLKLQLLYGFGLSVILYNVLLANTRAAILLAVLVVLMAIAKGMIKLSVGRIVMFVLIVLAFIPYIPESIYNRVLDLSNYSYEKSGSLRTRIAYWQAGLELAEEHWLIGTGVGNETAMPKLLNITLGTERASVHNEYLQTFIEVGIVGWGLFFGFIFLSVRYAFRAAANFRRHYGLTEPYYIMVAAQICMLAVLIYGVQVDVFHFPLKGWWLVASLSWVMYQISLRLDRKE